MTGLRLRGEVRGRSQRFDVPPGGAVVGSGDECDLVLRDPTVSRRHARIAPVDGGLEVHDLGSTNGTWVDNRRVDRAVLATGASLLFGRVTMTLDGVPAADLVVALPMPDLGPDDTPPAGPLPPTVLEGAARAAAGEAPRREATWLGGGADTTLGLGPLDTVGSSLVPRWLDRVWQGDSSGDVAVAAATAILQVLPVAELEVAEERGGVLFRGGDGAAADPATVIERRRGHVIVRAALVRGSRARSLAPVIDILALVVALAADRERPLPRSAPSEPPPLPAGGSSDPRTLSIYAQAARVAPGDVGVLVLGESGTGKEVLARWLHDASRRPSLVALNCAALPRDLLEAELFGVEKGTATGVEPRPGKLEMAHEGTLFLDEIGDMSLDIQAKILRVLQEGEVFRLGGAKPRPARARVVAATNHDLRAMVADGRFRLDLYHRIAGWVVELPPLRERPGDVPGLAVRFLAEEGRKLGRRFRGISQGALDLLVACAWPGNVRQLRQEIARCALFLDDGDVLEAGMLTEEVRASAGEGPQGAVDDLAARVETFERREIERALAAANGQVAEAARRLGLHRATLYRRMKALAIAGGDES